MNKLMIGGTPIFGNTQLFKRFSSSFWINFFSTLTLSTEKSSKCFSIRMEDGAVFARRNNHTYVFGTWWSLAGSTISFIGKIFGKHVWNPGLSKGQSWIWCNSRCWGCVLTLRSIVRGSSTTRWTWQPFKNTPWLLGPSKRTGFFVVLGSSWGWNMKAIKTTLQDSILLFISAHETRGSMSMCRWVILVSDSKPSICCKHARARVGIIEPWGATSAALDLWRMVGSSGWTLRPVCQVSVKGCTNSGTVYTICWSVHFLPLHRAWTSCEMELCRCRWCRVDVLNGNPQFSLQHSDTVDRKPLVETHVINPIVLVQWSSVLFARHDCISDGFSISSNDPLASDSCDSSVQVFLHAGHRFVGQILPRSEDIIIKDMASCCPITFQRSARYLQGLVLNLQHTPGNLIIFAQKFSRWQIQETECLRLYKVCSGSRD